MNREDIEQWTREAGGFDATPEFLERFAKLVVKHQREKDRENALAYMRMLHDSFSLASKPPQEKK